MIVISCLFEIVIRASICGPCLLLLGGINIDIESYIGESMHDCAPIHKAED